MAFAPAAETLLVVSYDNLRATGPVLDDLVVKRPGPGVRALGLVMKGVRKISDQVPPYTKWWSDQNHRIVEQLLADKAADDRAAGGTTNRLLVSIGDSSALGIGASTPELSYIGQLTDLLTANSGAATWSAINLSMSGARACDGIDRQLPLLARLTDAGLAPDLVFCCLGSNDVFWGNGNRRQSSNQRNARLRQDLTKLVNALPETAVVGETAGGSTRAQLASQAIRTASDARGLPHLNPWRGSASKDDDRPRLSEDRFHLNEVGYEVMAQTIFDKLASEGLLT